MADDPRVLQLLEEIMGSGRAPEEVCRASPELLPIVLERLQRLGAFEAEIAAIFPTHGPTASNPGASAWHPGADLPAIPGYIVLSVLGRGGMGVVYQARHLKLTRTVAIKMLLAGGFATPPELARFMREAQAIAVLRHPNIVQVFDVGDLEGRPYFTMEYVEGGSLAQKLAGVPQPARDASAMVATLAEAIQVAHAGGIVHRDLKPANILLTAEGTPKIGDFGLARSYSEGSDLTLGGTRLGTPSYMSPEQAIGREGTIGPSADIYSLGVVLYEMLTGRPPFKAETPVETERQVIHNDPPMPSRFNAKVPRDLETICLKCLRKEPERRYATAALLAEDLRRFLAGEPIHARPVGIAERTGKWVRRHPSAAGMIGAIALLVLLVSASALRVGWQRARINREVSDDLRQVSEFERVSDWNGARAALERAKGRLEPAGPDDLRRRARRAEDNLTLVTKFDRIRLGRTRFAGAPGQLTNEEAAEGYRAAFWEAGLPDGSGAPEDDAATIRRLEISDAILAAMDDWAICSKQVRPWVFAVSSRLDPDPWRVVIRDPAVQTDRKKLEELAASAPVALQPTRLLLIVAVALRNLGGDSTELLRAIQRQHPDDFWANFELGYLLIQEHPQDAISYLRAATAIRPDAASAHFDLGMALSATNRLSDAMHENERVLELVPEHIEARHNVGVCMLQLHRTDDAIVQFRDVIRRAPRLQAAHGNLGYAFESKKLYAQAAQEYREAIRIGPDSAGLRNNLATTLHEMDDLEGARGEYENTLRLDPESPNTHVNFGRLLKEMGRLREASDQFRIVVVQHPRSAEYRNELRGLRIRLGETEAVRAEWQRDLSSEPPEHDAWDGYAELCLFLGSTNEYHRACRELLARFGDSTDVHIAERTARACLLAPAGEEEVRSASALIDRALATDKSQYEDWMEPFLRFVHGFVEFRKNHMEAAISIMNGRASTVMGPAPQLVIAMAEHQLGRDQEARRALAAAVMAFDWRRPNADIRDTWIYHVLRREAEAAILPDLPAFLEGKYQPHDNDERFALQGVCQFQGRYAASAQLYADAFAADSSLAEDLRNGLRHSAACTAALAGRNIAQENQGNDPKQQAAWREQARQWLLADALSLRAFLRNDKARPQVRTMLTQWLADPDLAGIRDPENLCKLPEDERAPCVALWAQVRDLQQASQDAK